MQKNRKNKILGNINKTRYCWIWKGYMNKNGYVTVTIDRKLCLAHRVFWYLLKGKIPKDMCVLHKCDNRICVNPRHLFLGTRIENNIDRDKKKRTVIPLGSHNGLSKLKECKVKSIKLMIKKGCTLSDIGRKYNVKWQTIQAIKNGKTWKHVK